MTLAVARCLVIASGNAGGSATTIVPPAASVSTPYSIITWLPSDPNTR